MVFSLLALAKTWLMVFEEISKSWFFVFPDFSLKLSDNCDSGSHVASPGPCCIVNRPRKRLQDMDLQAPWLWSMGNPRAARRFRSLEKSFSSTPCAWFPEGLYDSYITYMYTTVLRFLYVLVYCIINVTCDWNIIWNIVTMICYKHLICM